MQVQKRSLNWFPKDTAWNELSAAREKRRQMMLEFQDQSSALGASLVSAWSAAARSPATG